MIAVRGAGSALFEELAQLLPPTEVVHEVPRRQSNPVDAERHLFCAGILRPKRGSEQTAEEVQESLQVNLWSVIEQCEHILSANVKARICIIGSESGISGSHDDVYAAAKRSLHQFIETRRLKSPHQQLVGIAPSIIRDAGMTLRRDDASNLMMRRATHPKQRFLDAIEVARLIHFCLYTDRGYLSNVVIRMNGGMHT